MAAHTKLTPEIHKRICSYLRAGAYKAHAAGAVGIRIKTLEEWIKRGVDGEEPYATFAEDVFTAQAEYAVRQVATISKASAGDWRAAAWVLERMHPKIYGSRRVHEIEPGAGIKEELIAALQRHYGMDGLEPLKLPATSTDDDESSEE